MVSDHFELILMVKIEVEVAEKLKLKYVEAEVWGAPRQGKKILGASNDFFLKGYHRVDYLPKIWSQTICSSCFYNFFKMGVPGRPSVKSGQKSLFGEGWGGLGGGGWGERSFLGNWGLFLVKKNGFRPFWVELDGQNWSWSCRKSWSWSWSLRGAQAG